MKNTWIKKINVIVSLWLIAIIAVLIIFGKQLSISGFYYASIFFGSMLAASNIFTISSGIRSATRRGAEAEKGYNNY